MKSIKHVWWTLIGHRKDIDPPQTRMDFKQSLDQSYSQGVVSFELWKSFLYFIHHQDQYKIQLNVYGRGIILGVTFCCA